MKKYDIQCPHCSGVFLETNGKYREDKPANGSMFAAKQHIVDAGWSVFPLYDTTEYADVVCPSCSQYLLDSSGMVIRKQIVGEIEETTAEIEKQKAMDALLDEYEPELPAAGGVVVELPPGGVFGAVENLLADKMTAFFAQTGNESTGQAPEKKARKPRTKKTE